ncbi:MerR family transcriptional regulator [Fictibacillus norfolkensis]|uniref:MerR family transcriptional regulator n=1 Tax=Fictibacillus norfolkensis TaxID=2762233 RepID=A0ABR8SKI3_9BACL|nr:MerR family transcriptional regulator [Fictibacillus norfolkensis]MBD7963993.1 MerR family transcriptional regulator [Fictibacillus norfolkensis]
MYTIGEVSKLLNISTHTLRFYEKEKIITPERTVRGDRRYSESHVQWLRFVIKLKETKMPLVQIQEYASLFLQGDETTHKRLNLLKNHQDHVQNQIQVLMEIDDLLLKKILAYEEYLRKQDFS